jgi:hydrogenase expression/formation protein HypE
VSGALGDHGLTVMGSREGLSFLSDVASDSAPLNHMIAEIIERAGEVHVLRDPTRGGLATTLNEIAEQSQVHIELDEASIPVHESVRSGCSFLGLDPLYLANEGKCICILPEEHAEAALAAMRRAPYGREAARVGTVAAGKAQVSLVTRIGGRRLLGMQEGAQLPRIC